MTILNSPQPVQASLASNLSSSARSVVGNRFGLLAVTAGVLSLTAYSSWGWLVAIGLAPILLAIAPCAAMCALGMCTMGGKSKTPTDSILPSSDDIAGKLATGTVLPGSESHAVNKKSGNCC